MLSNGWGCAIITTSYQADNGAGLTKGIIGLCNQGQPRKPDDWGALRAWAWGASRALDYFETDPAVDAKHVGIGASTLVARPRWSPWRTTRVSPSRWLARPAKAAQNFPGAIGANWWRTSPAPANIIGWLKYLKYGGPLTPGDLPVDAHEMIALCAPRPTFISYGASSGTPGAEGTWVDQHGSFMAAVAAGPVFRLLGKKDLGTPGDYLTDPMPPVNTALVDGELAWRQHDGGHTDGPNWPAFLNWANRYIPPPASANGAAAKAK